MNVEYITHQKAILETTLEQLLQEKEYTLLYFYPKDNTPWCTREAQDFAQHKDFFETSGIQIIGVSKDSLSSHCNFIEKQELNFWLISDSELVLHKEYGAWWEKNNYGKIVQGVIRSTFLLNKEWKILKERKNVKATWHVERLIKEIKEKSLLV